MLLWGWNRRWRKVLATWARTSPVKAKTRQGGLGPVLCRRHGGGRATAYKFKANRENPHQHPIGHAPPVGRWSAWVDVLPQTFKNTGDTFYGTDATPNQVSGTTVIGN